jgi:hypothetical protein
MKEIIRVNSNHSSYLPELLKYFSEVFWEYKAKIFLNSIVVIGDIYKNDLDFMMEHLAEYYEVIKECNKLDYGVIN